MLLVCCLPLPLLLLSNEYLEFLSAVGGNPSDTLHDLPQLVIIRCRTHSCELVQHFNHDSRMMYGSISLTDMLLLLDFSCAFSMCDAVVPLPPLCKASELLEVGTQNLV